MTVVTNLDFVTWDPVHRLQTLIGNNLWLDKTNIIGPFIDKMIDR